MPTIKPFDAEALLRCAAETPAIVTIEEHTLMGGLGSAVAEVLVEASFTTGKRVKRIGIPDAFPDQYGSQAGLMQRYAITAEHVVSTVIGLLSGTMQTIPS
jgi:transketolase